MMMDEVFSALIEKLDNLHHGWWDLVTEGMVSEGGISSGIYRGLGYRDAWEMRKTLSEDSNYVFHKAGSRYKESWLTAIRDRKAVVQFLDRWPRWKEEVRQSDVGGILSLHHEKLGFQSFGAAAREAQDLGIFDLLADDTFWAGFFKKRGSRSGSLDLSALYQEGFPATGSGSQDPGSGSQDLGIMDPRIEDKGSGTGSQDPDPSGLLMTRVTVIDGDEDEEYYYFNGWPTWGDLIAVRRMKDLSSRILEIEVEDVEVYKVGKN